MHDRRTIRTALAAFKGNICHKTYMFPNRPSPPLKKYLNLKGLPNKKCSCMKCHWHRMHDYCVRKSIISRRTLSRIQKGVSPWIRGPGVLFDEKKEGRKSRDTVPLISGATITEIWRNYNVLNSHYLNCILCGLLWHCSVGNGFFILHLVFGSQLSY
jgi:hypothetical protein